MSSRANRRVGSRTSASVKAIVAAVLLVAFGGAVPAFATSHDPLASIRPHHAALSVPDLDAATAWYRDKLGFRPLAVRAYPTIRTRGQFLERNGFLIELFERAGSRRVRPLAGAVPDDLLEQGPKHLGFIVDDVDVAMRQLRKGGVEIAAEAADVPELQLRLGFIRDNNGNLIEIGSPMAVRGEVAAAARAAMGGFSLANIALSTAQPDRMAEWYRDVLGFEIRDRAPGVSGVSTFIIEREGVSIDLIRVPNQRPIEPPLPPPDFLQIQGLRNLVFWVDDQAAANAHLKARGVQLLWESREVEGIGTAITAFRDPDGNLVALWERRPGGRQGSALGAP